MSDKSLDKQTSKLTATKILVVEDNSVERQLISKVLRNSDFDVVAIDCGKIVLSSVIDCKPDIILLDALLPDIDGFEVCEIVRSHPKGKDLPIVMLTGLDDMESINLSFEVGATDFFPKPVNHTLLVQRIRYLLRASDVTKALHLSQQSLVSAQRLAKLGTLEVNESNKSMTISAQLQQMLQLDGNTFEIVFEGTLKGPIVDRCHPEDLPRFVDAVRRVKEELQEVQFESRFILEDGSECCIEIHFDVIKHYENEYAHILGVMLDVSDKKRAEQDVMRLAYFDRLTSLPNRFLLELYLDQLIPHAHMQGASVAVIALDLDLFNRVNNSMGHGAGDAVLQQLTARLASLVAPVNERKLLEALAINSRVLQVHRDDMVGRLAADGFVVVMPGVIRGDGQASMRATQIKQLLEQPFEYRGQELFITASLGITYSESGSSTPEGVLQQADLALHEAKSQGRDEICEYDGELVAQASNRLAIQSELNRALQQNELELFYQPKLCAKTGMITGFEALIRWFHPEKGMIPPDQFISVAEESGQIVAMGEGDGLSPEQAVD
jgi:PleD family two-component response regulator